MVRVVPGCDVGPGQRPTGESFRRQRERGRRASAGGRAEVAVVERANLAQEVAGVGGREGRGSMSVEAEVERLRPAQALERERPLVDSEQEVTSPLRHEDGGRDRSELREARALGRPWTDGSHVPGERRQCQRSQGRIAFRLGNRAGEAGDEPGLHKALRHQRGVEVRPRLDCDDRSPGHARDERIERRAASERVSEGADFRVSDVRPGGEPRVRRLECLRSRAARRPRRAHLTARDRAHRR